MNLARMKTLMDPTAIYYHGMMKCRPSLLWDRLARHCRNLDLQDISFCLSFDCDLMEDAALLPDIDARLAEIGIRPSYAVPGEVLLEGIKSYSILRDRGREFLNHGYTLHTFWNVARSRHESCFFYDRLSRAEVAEDIRRGHSTLTKFLGRDPAGFRSPHFGTFQKKDELKFLHGLLRELKYEYSSSTVPLWSYQRGPIMRIEGGVAEVPVSGVHSRPLHILDTWGFFAAPDRQHVGLDYEREISALLKHAGDHAQPLTINLYADPTHIVNEPHFWAGMEVLVTAAKVTTMRDLVRDHVAKSPLISLD